MNKLCIIAILNLEIEIHDFASSSHSWVSYKIITEHGYDVNSKSYFEIWE